MRAPVIHCPKCKYPIPLNESLSTQSREQLEGELRADYDARLEHSQRDVRYHTRQELGLGRDDLKNRLTKEYSKAKEAGQRELNPRAEKR